MSAAEVVLGEVQFGLHKVTKDNRNDKWVRITFTAKPQPGALKPFLKQKEQQLQEQLKGPRTRAWAQTAELSKREVLEYGIKISPVTIGNIRKSNATHRGFSETGVVGRLKVHPMGFGDPFLKDALGITATLSTVEHNNRYIRTLLPNHNHPSSCHFKAASNVGEMFYYRLSLSTKNTPATELIRKATWDLSEGGVSFVAHPADSCIVRRMKIGKERLDEILTRASFNGKIRPRKKKPSTSSRTRKGRSSRTGPKAEPGGGRGRGAVEEEEKSSLRAESEKPFLYGGDSDSPSLSASAVVAAVAAVYQMPPSSDSSSSKPTGNGALPAQLSAVSPAGQLSGSAAVGGDRIQGGRADSRDRHRLPPRVNLSSAPFYPASMTQSAATGSPTGSAFSKLQFPPSQQQQQQQKPCCNNPACPGSVASTSGSGYPGTPLHPPPSFPSSPSFPSGPFHSPLFPCSYTCPPGSTICPVQEWKLPIVANEVIWQRHNALWVEQELRERNLQQKPDAGVTATSSPSPQSSSSPSSSSLSSSPIATGGKRSHSELTSQNGASKSGSPGAEEEEEEEETAAAAAGEGTADRFWGVFWRKQEHFWQFFRQTQREQDRFFWRGSLRDFWRRYDAYQKQLAAQFDYWRRLWYYQHELQSQLWSQFLQYHGFTPSQTSSVPPKKHSGVSGAEQGKNVGRKRLRTVGPVPRQLKALIRATEVQNPVSFQATDLSTATTTTKTAAGNGRARLHPAKGAIQRFPEIHSSTLPQP